MSIISCSVNGTKIEFNGQGTLDKSFITSDLNGLIKEGVNGTIIKPRDKEQLKNAMEKLLTDEVLRETLAMNARPLIAERYEQKKLWNELKRFYRLLK